MEEVNLIKIIKIVLGIVAMVITIIYFSFAFYSEFIERKEFKKDIEYLKKKLKHK